MTTNIDSPMNRDIRNKIEAITGDPAGLETTHKDTVIGALNEVRRRQLQKISIPVYATADEDNIFLLMAVQQAMTINKISVAAYAKPASVLGNVTLAIENYDVSATAADNLLVAATFNLEGLTDKTAEDLALTATGADLVLADGDVVYATIASSDGDMTDGDAMVITIEFTTDDVKQISVPVYATADTANVFTLMAVQENITITEISVAFHTRPASANGTVLLAIANYDISAVAADNLLVAATANLETITNLTASDLTLTATTADRALQDGDVVYATITSNNGDMTGGAAGVITIKYTVG